LACNLSVLSAVPAGGATPTSYGKERISTMTDHTTEVVLGVDTHADTHTAVAIDGLGRVLGTRVITVDPAGYRALLAWAQQFGAVRRAGVEATGCYGAGLARFLTAAGVDVIEVNRPNRQRRRARGKSDPTDAESAARAVLAGDATAIPKQRIGIVESIRVLRIARSSAVKACTQVGNQIKDLVVCAPDDIRVELRPLTTKQRVRRASRFRPDPRSADPREATRRALRSLARRYEMLRDELRELDADLKHLVSRAAPRLLAEFGVGIEVAGQLLVTAGDNPDRLHTNAALAALCGASPVEASSGKITRHRINRGGDRQANNALWTVARVRLQRDPTTKTYAARRTAEGKSQRDILRCLKRYLARRFHPLLLADLNDARTLQLT
jgi:transposase